MLVLLWEHLEQRAGSVRLSEFAWEAGRRRQTVERHYIKISPKTAKTEEKGTSTMNVPQKRPQAAENSFLLSPISFSERRMLSALEPTGTFEECT